MRRVLIVDDERLDREGLKRQIGWREFGVDSVLEAKNGREALEILRTTPVDLLITDISMPGMSGLELVREAKARSANLRIVLVSGYDDFEYARRAIALGVSAYVLKPVETEALEEAIGKALSEIRERDRDEEARVALRERADYAEFLSDSAALSAFLLKSGAPGSERMRGALGDGETRLAVIEADDMEETMADLSAEDGSAKLSALENCVRRFARGEDARAARMNPARYALLFRAKADGAELSERLSELSRLVYEECGFAATAIVSELVADESLLPDTYRECCRLMRKKALAGSGTVLKQRGGSISAQLSEEELFSRINAEISQSARDFDAKRLEDFVHSLFSELRDDRSFSLERARELTAYMLGVMRYSLSESGLSRAETEDPLLFERVMRCESVRALRDAAREYAGILCRALAEGGEQHQRQLGAQLVQYIEEHYGENISLKSIAPGFFYSPNHLGVLFKRATGMSFYDYLTRHRMKIAADLLKDPSLYMYEIARRVSFKNTNSFSAQFRRAYGVAPTEYALRARGEKQ